MSAFFPPALDQIREAVQQHLAATERGEAVIKRLDALQNIVGLSSDLMLHSGYDSMHDVLCGDAEEDEWAQDDALHPRDAVAIADAMLERWQRFRAIHAARVDLVPPKQEAEA